MNSPRLAVPDAWLYAAFAAFAAGTAVVTSLGPHRIWGWCAAVAYGAGAFAARRTWRRGRVAAWVAAGAVLVPLALLVGSGQAQPEVGVVHRAGALLLEHGSPYLGAAELAGRADYEAYNPYLPGMALLGVPWAVAGIDARLVFGAVFAAALAAAARRHGALLLLAGSPLVALPLTVGGDDLPVLGLVCLGLALAARDRVVAAGLVLGLAATLKATAFPAVAVGLALIAARGAGARRGAGRYAGAVGAVFAVGVVPVAVSDPGGFFENVVRFPLGLAGVESPAASPLPGRLLAELGSHGHLVAVVALVLAALGVGVSLVVRPPGDLRAAAVRLAVGLGLATLLMPATRWGYLIYPAVLLAWARIAGERRPAVVEAPAAPVREVAEVAA